VLCGARWPDVSEFDIPFCASMFCPTKPLVAGWTKATLLPSKATTVTKEVRLFMTISYKAEGNGLGALGLEPSTQY
jgi:hypothetical protein